MKGNFGGFADASAFVELLLERPQWLFMCQYTNHVFSVSSASRKTSRDAQRDAQSRRNSSKPPFVDVAFSAMRSNLHNPFRRANDEIDVACEIDVHNNSCLR